MSLHQKRGTLTVARSRFEVFELTRHIETSNEDPTPYVYITPKTSLFCDGIDI